MSAKQTLASICLTGYPLSWAVLPWHWHTFFHISFSVTCIANQPSFLIDHFLPLHINILNLVIFYLVLCAWLPDNLCSGSSCFSFMAELSEGILVSSIGFEVFGPWEVLLDCQCHVRTQIVVIAWPWLPIISTGCYCLWQSVTFPCWKIILYVYFLLCSVFNASPWLNINTSNERS